MTDREQIIQLYNEMYAAMVNKDRAELERVHGDSFVLVHMTGMRQSNTKMAMYMSYYRMSEFFMYDGDPDKRKYYELATKLFYEYYADYFEGENARIDLT